MYDEPGKTPHGLKHDPFKSCVVPRPIGWISTVDARGRHKLAPYSQFQNVTYDPPIVMFSANQNSSGRSKDSVRNAEQTGESVWNLATRDLRDAVNVSAQELPPEVDEFELAGLEKAPSRLVKPMRVARSPIHFDYTSVESTFSMVIPGDQCALPGGLEGSAQKVAEALAAGPAPRP